MKLTGLHLLLTYRCNLKCDHCFVWGSPWQRGTMTLQDVQEILGQAQDLGTIEWIYFEGGEPFLYYAALLQGVREAAEMGFKVGMVSNGYWATGEEDTLEWLKPFRGLIQDLSISSDLYHRGKAADRAAAHIEKAAAELGIPLGVIRIAQPEALEAAAALGQLPSGESRVMYRGRAAQALSGRAQHSPWEEFTECPYEDLRQPGRVHIGPLGYVHICQGIALGNLFQTPLQTICERYEPDSHPITGALLAGGPAELTRRFELPHQGAYADACHLCYQSRLALRERFPEVLAPDQCYGVLEG